MICLMGRGIHAVASKVLRSRTYFSCCLTNKCCFRSFFLRSSLQKRNTAGYANQTSYCRSTQSGVSMADQRHRSRHRGRISSGWRGRPGSIACEKAETAGKGALTAARKAHELSLYQEEFNGHSFNPITPDDVVLDASYFPGNGILISVQPCAECAHVGDASPSGPTVIFFPANMQLYENPSSRQ